MTDRLKDKVAIITGAASGIGAESARLFAENGARVLVADMQEELGREVAKSIGDAAAFQRVDVSSETDVGEMIAAATEASSPLSGSSAISR